MTTQTSSRGAALLHEAATSAQHSVQGSYHEPQEATGPIADILDGNAVLPEHWTEPLDRSKRVLSDFGDTEYVEDLIRPGQLVIVAAQEGTAKSMAFGGELMLRLAHAGDKFAGYWEVKATGPTLYCGEMNSDEEFRREEKLLAALGIARDALKNPCWWLDLNAATQGKPLLDDEHWRSTFATWINDHEVIAAIFDTGDMATGVSPWGPEFNQVIWNIRQILRLCPQLAIIVTIHLKKPQGRGDINKRSLPDVMGEWGRKADVVILMDTVGKDDSKVRIRTFKRIEHQRHLLVTKLNGLLVDPVDLNEAKAPDQKVPDEDVLQVLQEKPGSTRNAVAALIGVDGKTAGRYLDKLVTAGLARDTTNERGWTLYHPLAETHEEDES